MSYTVILEEDENGDLILPIPEELTTGDKPWLPGDVIQFKVMDESDKSFILINKSWHERHPDGTV